MEHQLERVAQELPLSVHDEVLQAAYPIIATTVELYTNAVGAQDRYTIKAKVYQNRMARLLGLPVPYSDVRM